MQPEALSSNLTIHETDLDSHFDLLGERYGLVLFLGTLLHLKSSCEAVESLARRRQHAIVRNRITRFKRAADANGAPVLNHEVIELRSVPAA